MSQGQQSSIKARRLVLCGFFAALMAVGAFIKIMIPLGIWQVTFSLQIFFALLSGMLLGSRAGFTSVAVYLIIGLTGVPIFAHGGGLTYIMKPTFGFLIGFAAAAFITGRLLEGLGTKSLGKLLFAGVIGVFAYYVCGLVYYYIMFNYVLTGGQAIGVIELISVWFLSTVIPDIILSVLAAIVAKRLMPRLRELL